MTKINNRSKRFSRILLCFCLVALLSLPVHASTKTKALSAYNKLLSGSTILWDTTSSYSVSSSSVQFNIIYLDNNAVPDLILQSSAVPHAAGYGFLYTFSKGKAVPVGTVNIDLPLKYYKKTGILVGTYSQGGWVTENYDQLSGTTLTRKLQEGKSQFTGEQAYVKWNGTSTIKITASQFKSERKKLVGSRKATKVKFFKNTGANRKKIL